MKDASIIRLKKELEMLARRRHALEGHRLLANVLESIRRYEDETGDVVRCSLEFVAEQDQDSVRHEWIGGGFKAEPQWYLQKNHVVLEEI